MGEVISIVSRPVYEIAQEIRRTWVRPSIGAVPFINAMHSINNITDHYYGDPASVVVRGFLNNSSMWQSDQARAIKRELQGLLRRAR